MPVSEESRIPIPRRRRTLLWGLFAAGFAIANLHRTATAGLAESLTATIDADAGVVAVCCAVGLHYRESSAASAAT